MVAHQAPLFVAFSRQNYWSGLPFPTPGDPSDPGIKPASPATCVTSGKLLTLFVPQFPKVYGNGNGTTLQYSRLENPMDGGAWKAAVHGVTKSRTRLSNFTFTFMHWRRKWQPTPVFLPGESQGQQSLVCCRLWGHTESDTTEAT